MLAICTDNHGTSRARIFSLYARQLLPVRREPTKEPPLAAETSMTHDKTSEFLPELPAARSLPDESQPLELLDFVQENLLRVHAVVKRQPGCDEIKQR